MSNISLKLFPWDNNEEPILINEKGYHWFVDKDCTKHYKAKVGAERLVVCLVATLKDGIYTPIERVVIDNNVPLYSHTNYESVCCWIDVYLLSKEKR